MIPPEHKKRFGQHFLKDESIAKRVCDSLSLAGKSYHQILEIGPGNGNLTQHFAFHPDHQYWIIEIDEEWINYLLARFPELSGHVLQADILDFDLNRLGPEPVGIIGNFPYNIASQIVLKIINNATLVPEFVGMYQWEVVQRLTAVPGNKQYGMLSVILQSYYDVDKLFKIPPGAFDPPPKVSSGALRGTKKEADYPTDLDYHLFFKVVKTAFQQRRKQLGNALKAYKPVIEAFNPEWLKKRPEELTPQDFQKLTGAIAKGDS